MLVAIDRNSFNYILKYNYLNISISQIIDLDDQLIKYEISNSSDSIIREFDRILPIFELDHEVLILEIEKSSIKINGIIKLSFNSIKKIYPLTGKAKNLLSGKLNQSIEISEPVFENIIENIKIKRAFNNRELLFEKLKNIFLLTATPSETWMKNVKQVVKNLLKNQNTDNSFLSNLIQYNYNPNEISSGNIEFLEKIGIITWITTKSISDGFTASNYYKRCEEFKAKINDGDYVNGLRKYFEIIENQSPNFNESHQKIKSIINQGNNEIDLFKVSYYFLAIRTKLNKNNYNLIDIFENLAADIHSDASSMAYVLFLIAYTFSFEQLYESIHILEKSPLLKSKFISKEVIEIYSDLDILKIRFESEKLEKEKNTLLLNNEEEIRRQNEDRILEEKRIREEDYEKERFEKEKYQIILEEEQEEERIIRDEVYEKEKDFESDEYDEQGENQTEDKEKRNYKIEESDKDNAINNESSDKIENTPKIELIVKEKISEPITLFDNSNLEEDHLKMTTSKVNSLNENKEISEEKSEEIKNISYEIIKDQILKDDTKKELIEVETDIKVSDVAIEIDKNEVSFENKSKNEIDKVDNELLKKNINEPEFIKDETNPISNVSIEKTSLKSNIKSKLDTKPSKKNTPEISVQTFEDEYLNSMMNENQEYYDIWRDFMDKFFEDKTENISFKKLQAQFKYKPFATNAAFKSVEQIKKLKLYFNEK